MEETTQLKKMGVAQDIDTAVILAAGMGTRMKGFTQERPKGFIEVDGVSLIDRSIKQLLNRGIKKIIIGTGYFHEHFDLLRNVYPQVSTFWNPDFASSGSMYTLYVLRHLIDGPFLNLESDLLYDPVALDLVIDDQRPDIVLASGRTYSNDEVWIQHSASGFLQNMSKDTSVLQHISGELVGISKITPELMKRMVSFAKLEFDSGRKMMNYEDALVGSSPHYEIFVKVIQDLAWCEIDDETHLERALTEVYPKILKRTRRPQH